MKTAQQWWDETAEGDAWATDQATIIERIQRDAFAAGFAEGAETICRGIDGHAAKLGSNLAHMVEASIPRGLKALAGVSRELAADPAAVVAAWKRIGAGAPRAAQSKAG
jgi:hypothetical protein